MANSNCRKRAGAWALTALTACLVAFGAHSPALAAEAGEAEGSTSFELVYAGHDRPTDPSEGESGSPSGQPEGEGENGDGAESEGAGTSQGESGNPLKGLDQTGDARVVAAASLATVTAGLAGAAAAALAVSRKGGMR